MERNSLQSIYSLFVQNLSQIYEQSEIKALFAKICEECFSIPKYKILNNSDIFFSDDQLEYWFNIVSRLKEGEPLQYILGYADFRNLRLKVTPSVLIPRPETEELVSNVLSETIKNPRILDIGTGSGCIAISLAKEYRGSNVKAMDKSAEALAIAKENGEKHNCNIEWIAADLFQLPNSVLKASFDIIVSNPPYVTESEKVCMHTNVMNYEPHEALFVPDDNPLLYYSHIARLAIKTLTPLGVVWLEINQHLGEEMVALYRTYFPKVTLLKDISGRDRFIRASKM